MRYSMYLEGESTVRTGPITVEADSLEEAIEKAKAQRFLMWLAVFDIRNVRASKVWDYDTNKIIVEK